MLLPIPWCNHLAGFYNIRPALLAFKGNNYETTWWLQGFFLPQYIHLYYLFLFQFTEDTVPMLTKRMMQTLSVISVIRLTVGTCSNGETEELKQETPCIEIKAEPGEGTLHSDLISVG